MSIYPYETKQGKTLYRVHLQPVRRGPQFTKRGFRTKTEARKWETEKKAELLTGGNVIFRVSKLGEYLDHWYETKKREVGESQANRIKQHLAHLIPELGHLKLVNISLKDVYEHRELKRKTLSARTVRAMEFCLKGALQDTVGNGYSDLLRMNPLLKLKPLRLGYGDVKAIEVFEINEQRILMDQARKYAEKHDLRWFIRPFLALYTGLRSGEVAGLQWGDIDWDKKTLRVERNVHYGRGDTNPVIKDTKTGKSRKIFLTEAVLSELKRYRAWVAERFLKVRVRINDQTHILFDNDLGPLHQTAPQERWDTLLRNAGLKHRGIHTLRHTHASNLIAQGLHIKSISERLGHTSIKTTMDTYGHMMDDDQAKTERALEAWEKQIGG